jgi:hypothetical protein
VAKKEKKPVVLTLDDKEYTEDDLNGNQEAVVAYNHIMNLQRKLEQSMFNHQEMEGGRVYWEQQLRESLKEEEAEVVEA